MRYSLRELFYIVLAVAFFVWLNLELLQDPSPVKASFSEKLVMVVMIFGGLLGVCGRGRTQIFGLTLMSGVLMVAYLQSYDAQTRFGLPPVTDQLAKRFLFSDSVFRPGSPGVIEYRVMQDGFIMMGQRDVNGYISGNVTYFGPDLAHVRGIDTQAIARYPDIGAFIVASRNFFSMAIGFFLAFLNTKLIASSSFLKRDKTSRGIGKGSPHGEPLPDYRTCGSASGGSSLGSKLAPDF